MTDLRAISVASTKQKSRVAVTKISLLGGALDHLTIYIFVGLQNVTPKTQCGRGGGIKCCENGHHLNNFFFPVFRKTDK
jgi:hypothetical protein